MIENGSFRILSEKFEFSKNVIVLPEFATSTHVFREVIGTSAKALEKMSYLEVVASSSLVLCRS